jgi:hypothetical protein
VSLAILALYWLIAFALISRYVGTRGAVVFVSLFIVLRAIIAQDWIILPGAMCLLAVLCLKSWRDAPQ